MVGGKVLFDRFEIPILKGLDYLLDESKPMTDYLFINEVRDKFSMYFELGQKPFEISKQGADGREYCLFEIKRKNRKIYFYCPERVENRQTVMWYFYVELFDEMGKAHLLPGQIRLSITSGCLKTIGEKSLFIEVLERIKLKPNTT